MQMTDLERLKDLSHNGEKVKPTFSREEMEMRNGKLRKYMAEKDIDIVLFTSYHNINYYSDYLYTAFGRDYGLFVTQDQHVTISANIDAGMPWRRSFGDNIVYTDWHRDNFFYAIQHLAKKGKIDKGTIGIEFDEVNLDLRRKLEDAMPNFEFVDVANDLMMFRTIKSKEEIEHIKNGAKVCNVGGDAVKEAIGAGVPEYEVALAGTQAMTREIAKLYPHAELRDSWIWFQSGVNTDGAHNWATSREIQKGDILSHNSFSMIAGYYTALERTMFYDHVSDAHLKYWEINCEALEMGIDLIKPGVTCAEVCEPLNDFFRSHGLLENRTFGYGHSFGVLSHYYGREAGLEFREDIETVLEPGMVVSMEPMIMIPEGEPGSGGYREHDILVINDDGSIENITGYPVGPEHHIIK